MSASDVAAFRIACFILFESSLSLHFESFFLEGLEPPRSCHSNRPFHSANNLLSAANCGKRAQQFHATMGGLCSRSITSPCASAPASCSKM
jgi:hypothetical protein